MRCLRLLPVLLAAACVLPACATADRGAVGVGSVDDAVAQFPVSVTIEHPSAGRYPTFVHFGSMFVAGEFGQRYDIRLTNHSAERVEAVVSVDGRDVITGQVGDFEEQRGYVIEPFGSVVVEGFRQSLDQVAAFRFTSLGDSYSAQRGTPQNAGVIGVAVFEERGSRRNKNKQAFATAPTSRPSPPPAQPFPDARARRDSGGDAAFEPSAPAAEDEAAPLAPGASGASGAFAPPAQQNELGTQFGESQFSAVHQVEFKRRRKRKPDAFITVHYDSLQGLAARGVPVHTSPAIATDPDPFPG